MLTHSMMTEMYVLCVLTLGVGDLLKSGSISTREIVSGAGFRKQLLPFFPFAGRNLVHHFFLRFSLSLHRFGWERRALLVACVYVVTWARLKRKTSLL
jgi:hypothetical protein